MFTRDNPGPATYDSIGKVPAKQFSAAEKTAIFNSNVPNCKDLKVPGQEMPGPGSYLKDDKLPESHSTNASFNGG